MAQTPFTPIEPVTDGPLLDLPIAGEPPAERCDAVRNRRRILETAERLFATEGVEEVSVERIATEAGVGKGTVFRRFGDRGGLLEALLSEREAAFQEACIRGPAPLGPAADPVQRLKAFGPAALDLHRSHGELLRAAETRMAGARYNSAPYAFQRAHLVLLLSAAAPAVNADWAADALLSVLGADLVYYQRNARGVSIDQVAAGWCQMVEGFVSAAAA